MDKDALSSATVRRGLVRKFPEAWKPRRPSGNFVQRPLWMVAWLARNSAKLSQLLHPGILAIVVVLVLVLVVVVVASFTWTRRLLAFRPLDDNYRGDRFCPATATPRFPRSAPLSDIKRDLLKRYFVYIPITLEDGVGVGKVFGQSFFRFVLLRHLDAASSYRRNPGPINFQDREFLFRSLAIQRFQVWIGEDDARSCSYGCNIQNGRKFHEL